MPFDEHTEPEIQGVLDTAAILEITEFQVFSIAYSRWFGRKAGDEVIEPFFCDYMFNMIVPSWVNHFTRLVIGLYKRGTLDPREFGIQPPHYSSKMALWGLRLFLILVFIVWLLIMLAISAVDFYGLENIVR